MTREELAAEIEHTLVEHRADGVLAERTADAVIRLVVEACCERVTVVRNDLLDGDFAVSASGAECARQDLVKTFLLPEAPSELTKRVRAQWDKADRRLQEEARDGEADRS